MDGLKFRVIFGDYSSVFIEAADLDSAKEYADIFYPTWIDVRYV